MTQPAHEPTGLIDVYTPRGLDAACEELGVLPFTGLDVGIVVVVAVLFLGIGVALRRFACG